jgi:hypothetical protein
MFSISAWVGMYQVHLHELRCPVCRASLSKVHSDLSTPCRALLIWVNVTGARDRVGPEMLLLEASDDGRDVHDAIERVEPAVVGLRPADRPRKVGSMPWRPSFPKGRDVLTRQCRLVFFKTPTMLVRRGVPTNPVLVDVPISPYYRAQRTLQALLKSLCAGGG